MVFVKDWLKGFRFAKGYWGLVWLLFFANAVLSLLIAQPVYQNLRDAISNSVVAKELLVGYHHGFITDILREHGDAIMASTGSLGLLMILSILVASFVSAGALSNFYQSPKTNWEEFFRGASRYFKPYLSLSILHIFAQGLFMILILIPTLAIVGINPDNIVNETGFFKAWGFTMLLYFPCMLCISMLFDYARIFKLNPNHEASNLAVLKLAYKSIINKPLRPIALIFFHTFIILLCLLLYYLITSQISWISWGALVIFLLQQILIWFRTFARMILYAGELILSKQLAI